MANCAQCGRRLPAFSFRKICEWCVRHEAAQRGEEPEDAIQPVMPVPWASGVDTSATVTIAFFAINLIVFVAMALEGIATNPTAQQLIPWGENFGPLTMGGQEWRLLTCVFVHGGPLHILFNLWCLWDLGAMCESLYGHWTFAVVYLISGVGASLTSVWWHPVGASVGASGAIFGIVGALIASHYLGEFSAPLFAVRARLRSVLLFAGYALIFGAMSGRTDNAAHIGGLITGLLLGALIARFAPGRDVFPRIAVLLLVGLMVLGSGAWLHHSRSYLIHASRGDDLLEKNKIAPAIVELNTAVRQRPDYVPAHFSLAHAYFNQEQYDRAENELLQVLKLDPTHTGARYELGIVYLNQQRIQEAKDQFNRVLSVDKNDGYAHLGLGMALAAEQNDTAAIEEYKRAVQLQPDLESVYYRLGLAQVKLKNYDAAIDAFRAQLDKIGDDAGTEAALAEAYRAKGMLKEAEEAAQKAEKMKATN
jgi:membrane associated rhomboid family serine protease/Tfp pilus assembly protein PilF